MMLFVTTHAIVLGYGIFSHGQEIPAIVGASIDDVRQAASAGSLGALFLVFVRAYTMGGGTYTGIEAVSNSMSVLREPKVATGKRTMLYMAVSLAITAAGILFCYMLWHVRPEPGRTLNAVLIRNIAASWNLHPGAFTAFVTATLFAEAALLVAAAQAGFVGGPAVLSNMANDGWVPKRLAHLSDRLVTSNGVVLMSAAAAAFILGTRGSVSMLVVMYAINVFIDFVLSQLGMCVHWWKARRRSRGWWRDLGINGFGLLLCTTILGFTLIQKFTHGGYITIILTAGLVLACLGIKLHYKRVSKLLRRLDIAFREIPESTTDPGLGNPAPEAPTAVLFIGSYGGFGIHTFFAIHKAWPRYYQRFIFLSVGVVDTAHFKGVEEVESLERETENTIRKYVRLARGQGCYAVGEYRIGPDAVESMMEMARKVKKEYPQAVFFSGKLVFPNENWMTRMLHNQTAYAVQREMQFEGMTMIVLPVRAI